MTVDVASITTPDLPPGARSRVVYLLLATAIAGFLTYWAFGRVEILWMTVGISAVWLYLLAGVALALRHDKLQIAPLLQRAHSELPPKDYCLIVDPHGTVLALSPDGEKLLGHSQTLVGQRFADVLENDGVVAAFVELLSFGRVSQECTKVLSFKDERGQVRCCTLKIFPWKSSELRRAGIVALQRIS